VDPNNQAMLAALAGVRAELAARERPPAP
jgi:hypothetical protein